MNILFLLMPKNTIAYVYGDNSLKQGLEKIRAHYYTAIPVLNRSGEYIGTVNEGDFLWHMLDNNSFEIKKQEEYTITDIMRENWNAPVKISATIDDLLFKVMVQNFVPVIDDRNLFVGIITRKDVIKYYYDKGTYKQENYDFDKYKHENNDLYKHKQGNNDLDDFKQENING